MTSLAIIDQPVYQDDAIVRLFTALIANDLFGFGKWKNPLLDTITRAFGCRVQILKVRSGIDNIAIYGRSPEMGSAAVTMFHATERVLFNAIRPILKGGVSANDVRYWASFYAGFVAGFTSTAQDAIARNAQECYEIGAAFPQVNAPYPTHANIDETIAAKGYELALTANYAPATKPAKVAKATVVVVTPAVAVAAPVTVAEPVAEAIIVDEQPKALAPAKVAKAPKAPKAPKVAKAPSLATIAKRLKADLAAAAVAA